jgi:exopolysaccharide production protein ExoZ
MSRKKLNLIQVLRGLAAVLVVLAHTDLIFNQNLNQNFFNKVFTFGGSGVDFFFVLSGFIMFYIHQHDIGHSNKVGTFFFKRFTRVYPLYWVILTSKISASLIFAYDTDRQSNIGEYIKAFLLFPQDRNILSTTFLGVSWTLSFEIFFYLLFGLLIWLKPKLSFPIISAWLIGVLLNFFGIFQLTQNNLWMQMIFADYNLEFIFGCLAAYVLTKYQIKYGMPIICTGAFLYTLSAINYYYSIIKTSSVITFGIPSTLIVLGCVALEQKKNINVPNLLLYIGNASYSIYLAHGFFINNITKIILKLKPNIADNLLALNLSGIIIGIIAIFCGCLIYTYIEKPLFLIFKPKIATT